MEISIRMNRFADYKGICKGSGFRFVQAGIGEGVLGGNIVSHRKSGEIAAQMVMGIFKGTDPSEISMMDESPNEYYPDQQVLDKFNISKNLIPDDAEVINQKDGFWKLYGKVILAVLVSQQLLCLRYWWGFVLFMRGADMQS